jgi:hypothetical protein
MRARPTYRATATARPRWVPAAACGGVLSGWRSNLDWRSAGGVARRAAFCETQPHATACFSDPDSTVCTARTVLGDSGYWACRPRPPRRRSSA